MRVSVVISTYNSQDIIEECLLNLAKCHHVYPDMEIIVVDNYSTDKTAKIAWELADVVYFKGSERTAQANYGVKMSTGEVIYLTGSDMTRDFTFILEGVMRIQEGYDAIYMSVLTDSRVNHFWGRVKALERETYIGTFIESARFFKKDVWEELGGFDENMIGLEEDFQHRLDYHGYRTGRIHAREYHLHEDDSLKKIFRKAFYYGKFMRSYLKSHPKRGYKQLSPFRPNLCKFLKHPILLGGFIIYKIVQYAGGVGGLLCNSTEK